MFANRDPSFFALRCAQNSPSSECCVVGIHGSRSSSGNMNSHPSLADMQNCFANRRTLLFTSSFGTGSTKNLQLWPTISSISYPQSVPNPVEHPISGHSSIMGSAMVRENCSPFKAPDPSTPKTRSTASWSLAPCSAVQNFPNWVPGSVAGSSDWLSGSGVNPSSGSRSSCRRIAKLHQNSRVNNLSTAPIFSSNTLHASWYTSWLEFVGTSVCKPTMYRLSSTPIAFK
mmetsp:Transcript_2369/g.5916  ORF Transcript_2369/g.5916 Transcript_2369/m.5916 type:complete len:229 (-) Transcript_2369:525-1211(-)